MADEAIFSHIERLQGDRPWGSFLDAGTGRHSLSWVTGLETTRWTAITASDVRRRKLGESFQAQIRSDDKIVDGNWTDPLLLHGEVFDVVLADYLLGAVDFFAPYFQEQLLARLRPHVRQRLYVVGLEPYADPPTTAAGRVIREITRLRDACILLAAQRPYREYPLDWTVTRLEQTGFRVEDARSFPIIYGPSFINAQLNVCGLKLRHVPDRALVKAIEKNVEVLRERALTLCEAEKGLRFGEDYVIEARPG